MQDKPAGDGVARKALAAFGVIAAAVTVIAVIESYSNLLAFALAYGLSGWRAAIAPGAVDSFIVLGELLLFAAVILSWGKVLHILGVIMASWGFLLSCAGNIWHAHAATAADRAVAAVWPVTAAAGLAGALLIARQLATVSGVPPGRARGPAGSRAPVVRGTGTGPPRRAPRMAVVDEQALLARLLASGKPLPSYRSLSLAETGMTRSAPVKRAHDAAWAAMNGGSHD